MTYLVERTKNPRASVRLKVDVGDMSDYQSAILTFTTFSYNTQ